MMRPLLIASSLLLCAATPPIVCDVLVAGGSLASFAAAVTAANSSSSLRVCFTDPTDWPGGQLTASAVPAVDFGPSNARPENLPASFAAFLYGPSMPGTENLGNCWVSKKCFTPQLALDNLISPLWRSVPNLVVYLNTVISYARRDAASGNITGLSAVRRTATSGNGWWQEPTSAVLSDWYAHENSSTFTKEVLEFVLSPGGVVVEGTEFGDVLATAAGLSFAQGMEAPEESSTSLISFCGQATTVPFYATWGRTLAPSPDPWPPGSGNGDGFSQQGMGWDRDWTYRRVDAPPSSSASKGSAGETSVINVGGGNDLGNAYLFLAIDSPELVAQRATPGAWRGGVNLTAMREAEQRAYGFYHWFKNNASHVAGGDAQPFLTLNASVAGTSFGLSKLPYLRDSRRSTGGLGGFRIFKSNLTQPDPLWHRVAFAWPDAVAIGQYFYADIHKMDAASCPYPSYLVPGAPVLPYYIPFRALTVDGAPNLLVVGKSMSMTFFANAAIRLHPEEWATGVAAGAAAGIMVSRGWDTAAAYTHIAEVRLAVKAAGNPTNWTL